MSFLQRKRHKYFSENEKVETFLKETFRKTIHLCSAFVPFFAEKYRTGTVAGLAIITALYILFEFLRINGKRIFLVSAVTRFAARKRDNGGFVLGPVTLSVGIILTLLLFDSKAAKIGIFALAFGDGLASLVGKCFGKKQLRFFPPKTVEGCLTCFTAVFLSSLIVSKNLSFALLLATIASIIEVFPLKDLDNLLIPIVSAFTASVIL